MLKSDSVGSARLAAAVERIHLALADAVERHPTKDPGMRGTLKRASVICYSKSEPQKKIALDTKQDSAPRMSVYYGGAQPSTTTSTDQNTNVIRTNSEDHIGGDVPMRGNGADDISGGYPSSAGPNSRRRITTKRRPRVVRDEQSSTNESTDGATSAQLLRRHLTVRKNEDRTLTTTH